MPARRRPRQAACRAGGNAIDAAVAASLALAVVQPHYTSIGGDLIALVRAPDGAITTINATGYAAPARRR